MLRRATFLFTAKKKQKVKYSIMRIAAFTFTITFYEKKYRLAGFLPQIR